MISLTNGVQLGAVYQPRQNSSSGLSLGIGSSVPLDFVNKAVKEYTTIKKFEALNEPETINLTKDNFSHLIGDKGYQNFKSYIAEKGLKESELTDEEVGFYSLKANFGEKFIAIESIDDYRAYKKENEEKHKVYTEYQSMYGESLSSMLHPKPMDDFSKAYGYFEDKKNNIGKFNSTELFFASLSFKNELATIDTQAGEVRLIFDLNSSGTIDNINENLKANQLVMLDSNRDGMLDSNDRYFDKLKVAIKDEDGNDKIVKASSVFSFIDLEQFVDSDKLDKKFDLQQHLQSGGEIKKHGSEFRSRTADPFKSYIDPSHTHKRFEGEELDSYFEKHSGADGWVDFRRSEGSIGVLSEYLNFAYKRTDANGKEYLQKFNYGYASTSHNVGSQLSSLQAQKFNSLYSEYMKLKAENDVNIGKLLSRSEGNNFGVHADSIDNLKSASMIALEREFENTTNLSFSMKNLEKVKSLVEKGEITQVFKDMDEVVAMRKNDDGTYTLKFDTGRTIDIKELYYDTGDFVSLDGDKEKRASMLMNDQIKTLDKDDNNKLDGNDIDFTQYAIMRENKLQTLKDAGVELINLIQGESQNQYFFELQFGADKKESMGELYKIKDMSNPYSIEPDKLKEYINHPYQNIKDVSVASRYEEIG